MADKPTHRIIAKMTDSRTDRWENVGVGWLTRRDDGTSVLSLKLSPFTDGAALVRADGLLVVPYEQRKSGGAGERGQAPPLDSSPMPSDDDIPF